MATRQEPTPGLKKKAPAKKAAVKTPARRTASARRPAAAPKPEPDGKKSAEGLLRAGLKALGNVRDDVARRQTNVIEGLLGFHKDKAKEADKPAEAPRGFPSLDSFGIRKFEDVFDQRVATALQRLGVPTAQEVQALRDEVRQLRERLASASAPASKRKR